MQNLPAERCHFRGERLAIQALQFASHDHCGRSLLLLSMRPAGSRTCCV
jgi:hypothetical protein